MPNLSGPGEVSEERTAAPTAWLHGAAGGLVLVGVFFAVLMGAMDSLVVATVLPRISADLHQSGGVAFVVSAYLISSTVSIPLFARLSDIASRRNVFLVGLAVFMIGSALAGLSQNLPELIAFRAVQGVGGGGVFPVAIAMVAVLFPPATRARAVGILSGAAGLAIVLGPLVGSYIVSVTTWRWVFYINLPFGAIAAVALLTAVGALRPARGGKLDLPGMSLLAAWVGALMFALVQVAFAGWAWTDPRVLALLGLSAALAVWFVVEELRSPAPVVPLRLLRQRTIFASSGSMLFGGAVVNTLIPFLSVLVGTVLLANGPNATVDVRDLLYFFAVPIVLGAVLGGQLLTRASYRSVIAPALAIAGIAGVFLATTTASTPLWILAYGFFPVGGIAAPLIPLGLGVGLALSGTTVAVQNEAPTESVGAAVGLTRFLQSLGGAVGLAALTAYVTGRSRAAAAGGAGPAAVLHAVVGVYDAAFLVLAGCLLVAFLFALRFPGRSSAGGSPSALAPVGDIGAGGPTN